MKINQSSKISMGAAWGIDLVIQAVPPTHDAIGEYTACLAAALAKRARVRILTSCDMRADEIDGVQIVPCFTLRGSQRFGRLAQELRSTEADAVVLQYNPFAWGNRGWAFDLVQTFERAAASRPERLWCTTFHEMYMLGPGIKSWIMRLYQKEQFRRLVAASKLSFFCTGRWAERCSQMSCCRMAKPLPAGSNLPLSKADRETTRRTLGIDSSVFLCGAFGGAHPSRKIDWIESAVQAIHEQLRGLRQVKLLHVGGGTIDWKLEASKTFVTGRVNPGFAADAIAGMDLMLNPFVDGNSSRRTSSISALQQGCPLATTSGSSTESLWSKFPEVVAMSPADDKLLWNKTVAAFALEILDSLSERRMIAKKLYDENFSWETIVNQMLADMTTAIHSNDAMNNRTPARKT